MYKILNIANIHALDAWGKRILICNNKIFFLCFFSVYSFCNATFFHSGYVIKPPQPSSALYGAPPSTGNPFDEKKVKYASDDGALLIR